MYEEDEDDVATLTRVWAEAVIRQAEAVRVLRRKSAEQDWQYDQLAEWSPTEEDLARTWREQWAAEHILVWAAYQMQRWTVRLAADLKGDHDRARIAAALNVTDDPLLKDLRDALEHLDDAVIADGVAIPISDPPPRNDPTRSLRKLPGQQIGFWLGGRNSRLFGLIDPDALEQRASAVLAALDAETDAYTEYLIDEYLANRDDGSW